MKKHILAILQVDNDGYEQIVIDLYFEWCCNMSDNHKTLQKLLTCTPLFNWWCKQLQVFEKLFVDDGLDYANHINPDTALDYYKSMTKGIMKIFSRPLIKQAYRS